jgi:CRISPR-associated protein Cmr3
LHPFGGERRLARWQAGQAGAAWRCPDELTAALRKAKAVRLVLATPALFARGWLPGWLDETTLEGRPPGTSSLRLRLVGGCVERWRPISGWGLENGAIGPKPVRRLTPAGSVYFFTVQEGSAAELAGPACWLRSVIDEETDKAQDRRDGFGLGLWGIWQHPQTGEN